MPNYKGNFTAKVVSSKTGNACPDCGEKMDYLIVQKSAPPLKSGQKVQYCPKCDWVHL